jgi:hypothetical protein
MKCLPRAFGAEVGVEGQEPIDSGCGCAQPLGNDLCRFQRHIPEVLVDFLQRAQDQLLAFLPIFRLEMGHQPANVIEIDSVGSYRRVHCFCHSSLPGKSAGRRGCGA